MITFDHLSKVYNGISAVDDLTFEIPDGEIFGLLGPNGAGKSTTILMLTGLIEPTAGRCLIDGVEVAKNPIGVKHRIGYMPEDVGFYTNLTAGENLDFFARLYGMNAAARKSRIDELLSLVNLDGVEKPVGGYSKGMRQRLGIAKAILNDPAVIILDEPTANLDPQGVADYRQIIRQMAADGKTILVSSHILSEVSLVCSSIGVLSRGKLVAQGTWKELTQAFDATRLEQVKILVETRDAMPEFIHPDLIAAEYANDNREAVITARSDIRDTIADTLRDEGVMIRQLCFDRSTIEESVLSYYNTGEKQA
ncbi:ABC transporter ATP-binding protein [Methanogenium sp. S4BF]|uniref:ABC transporter ATP-binding protein n=1 Tax=Methanogenium sp. S4BF TaxID=1789226 RepID=UPI0024178759|nr:ABC transporter ATP-binding protein [Methanogenium sp. S4BF]WFN34105.1 ABC transporter ATP-binding protein [Methanogenium sp. S4BF]